MKKITAILLGVGLWIGVGSVACSFIPSIPEMFKLNKQLQEEGFYMAEFEFKMLGITYYLDRGKYLTAYSKLNELNDQLKSREGLIKVPKFESKKEELEFYLNLQNPDTGAFMDSSYPLCTYTGPTGNVLEHLAQLARETGQPLRLKYPLKYLDSINTLEKLKAYLDDVAAVGWIGNKFPQTSFHFARDLLSLFYEDNTVEKYKLYTADPEWKRALVKWFYDIQDSATGLWGPRAKNGKLRRKDTMNTASVLKSFVDEDGNNIHKDFPLRYKDEMAGSFLEKTITNIPADNELDEWHEWELDNSKVIRTLIRYLWDGLSAETREKAREMAGQFIMIKFEKFFVTEEGAFSYYPRGEHATLDGTGGMINFFDYLGCFSEKKYVRLWGKEEDYADIGNLNVAEITGNDLKAMLHKKNINSIRFYATVPKPGNYTNGVLGIFYPEKKKVPDVIELITGMRTWIKTTSQSMGNWTSKEVILRSLSATKIMPVPVLQENMPLDELNRTFRKNKKLVLIGFDILQIPVSIWTYNRI